MNRSTALDLYEPFLAYDAEQNPTATWGAYELALYEGGLVTYEGAPVSSDPITIMGNLQPKALTEAEIAAYGVKARDKVKVLFFDCNDEVVVGRRLYDGATGYDIRAVNVWPKHSEAILEPI